jgi:hypothetical protein
MEAESIMGSHARAGYGPSSASVDIVYGDPTVSISATGRANDVSGATATFTITRSGEDFTGDLEVAIGVTGEAHWYHDTPLGKASDYSLTNAEDGWLVGDGRNIYKS